MISILFNYTIAYSITTYQDKQKRYYSKRSILQFGLFFNIGLLIYFKYMDFFIDNTNMLFGTEIGLLHMALPLAISFFTLQQIAFLVDTYEGLAQERDLLDYTLFVTFFPQLIAGPIVHHREMMPQFKSLRNKFIDLNNIAAGMFIFSIGLFKKVILADTFAIWAKNGFDVATTLNTFEAWATSLSYTFQLYFDFSGYTDMAIGAALLFNIRLPQNFNSPFKSTGIIEFWSRWHITLTNFITTYIYTPILRSYAKLTFNKAMLATVIAFLIAGLWHGASWMFVIFGGIHGVALVVNHYWKKKKLKMPKPLAWFITFNLVNFANIFFRAKDLDDAIKVLTPMYQIDHIVLSESLAPYLDSLKALGVTFGPLAGHIHGDIYMIMFLFLGFSITLLFHSSMQRLAEFRLNFMTALLFGLSFSASVLLLRRVSEFIYFNF